MRVLCLLTLSVTWKVASSLNTRRSSNSPSFNITCIWVQKSSRADLLCLSNAGANAVYKVLYASVFLPLAKRLLKASGVQD